MAAIEEDCSKLPPMEADELRADTSHLLKNHCPQNKINISKEEYKAIKKLREDQTRVVLTAEKEVATDKQDYTDKALTLLTDTNTISKDPTSRFRNRLISTLKDIEQQDRLSDTTYRKLYPTSAVPQVLWPSQNPQNRHPSYTPCVQ